MILMQQTKENIPKTLTNTKFKWFQPLPQIDNRTIDGSNDNHYSIIVQYPTRFIIEGKQRRHEV